jgi:rubredoxin
MSITAFTPELMKTLRAAGYHFYCAREYREVNSDIMLFIPYKNLRDALVCFNGLEENKTNKLYLYDDVIGGTPESDQQPHTFFIELPAEFAVPLADAGQVFVPRSPAQGRSGIRL